MVKKPDIKTRKKLRIAICFFYLLQILMCTFPFIHGQRIGTQELTSASPFYMVYILFGIMGEMDAGSLTFCITCIALILIPVVGFFFCALDKERNLKNIVSILCCFTGVFLIMFTIPTAYMSLGAVVAVLLYIIIMFLTTVSMVMRLSKDDVE